jgi:hypothetical protein
MPGAVHSSASVGVDSAEDRSWFAAIKRAWRRERPITTHEAAQALGQAAAEKRRRQELTTQERKDALNAQLRAECDAGLVCGRPRA